MIKVSVHSVHNSKISMHKVVSLKNEEGTLHLPIWISSWEGDMIATYLRKTPTSRPMTFNFVEQLLKATSGNLEEVRIESLKNDTFYAVTKVTGKNNETHEIDCRPSDALALAVLTDTPIYVAEEVMSRAGVVPGNVPHIKLEED